MNGDYSNSSQTQKLEKCYKDNNQSFLTICGIYINDSKLHFTTKSMAKVNVYNLSILLKCIDADIINGNKVYKEFRGKVGFLGAFSENAWTLKYEGYINPDKCNKYKIKVLDFNI